MSDTLASERTLERPSQDGQVGRASEAQPQSDTGGSASTSGQPTQDENIRKLQSTYDKKLAEQDRTYKAQMQQQNQFIQNLQREIREARKNAAPDDYTRIQIDLEDALKERDQYAQAYQQSIQAQQAEQARASALREVADEFGVSVKDLDEATDYMSAVKLAVKAQQAKEQRKQQQDDDKRERNMPDIGSGAPRTAIGNWEQEYRDAQARKDTAAQMRLLRTRPKQKGE